MAPHLQVVLWRDIFVVIDDGRAPAHDYPPLKRRVTEQASRHAFGIGGLVVVPPNAHPPTPEARDAISTLLADLGDKLRCVCWLVEGGGFQGAMARAVLTGLRLFGRYPYATHLSTQLTDSLKWLLPHLADGSSRLRDVDKAAEFITMERVTARR
jgi:hypothetical protein